MGLYVRQAEAATSKWINELKNGKLKMMKLHGGNEVKTQYLRWMVAKSESPVENGGQHPTIFEGTIRLLMQDFATNHPQYMQHDVLFYLSFQPVGMAISASETGWLER